ncbi:DUF4397 domain-containing protein [Chitinophaga arvensicola]|uniref:DUF4397 domain-containing protein n=1 Tax=Chitinophaga arvensicola TaxID=29529 RepID=A0A1I0S511_9BACT|nr:DUF4397 domain-containing protein [Chitinophaga arvensicola]SEW49876.1 protein of unknown function [Chitinophaga arvensicola]
MKNNTLFLLSSFTMLAFSACNKTDYLDVSAGDRPPLSANIRFANARIATTGIQFWTFTQKITTDAVLPGKASPYAATTFGNVQINFTEGNGNAYKASRQFGNSATYSASGGPNGPIAGYYHTVFAASAKNDASKDTLLLFYDDLSAPAAGKAKLRFVHLAQGIGNVGLKLKQNSTETVLYTAIPYGSAGGSNLQGGAYDSAPFTSVNAGTISLVVSAGENALPVAIDQQALSNITLDAGKIYTVFIRADNKGVVSAGIFSATAL